MTPDAVRDIRQRHLLDRIGHLVGIGYRSYEKTHVNRKRSLEAAKLLIDELLKEQDLSTPVRKAGDDL